MMAIFIFSVPPIKKQFFLLLPRFYPSSVL
jgi:hypothetical protein